MEQMEQNKNDKSTQISPAVVNRLPRYYRYLSDLLKVEKYKVSSKELSELMNLTASQIRQDLNCFGGFGQQGYGYSVEQLRDEIGRILGADRKFTAIIAGTGNLGTTIAKSGLLPKRGVELCALFDNSPAVVGKEVAGLVVLDISEAARYCKKNKIDIAVLTLPKDETDPVANMLAGAGIKGFWNFSNMELKLDDHKSAQVQNIHMGDSLMLLCFQLNR